MRAVWGIIFSTMFLWGEIYRGHSMDVPCMSPRLFSHDNVCACAYMRVQARVSGSARIGGENAGVRVRVLERFFMCFSPRSGHTEIQYADTGAYM